MIRALWLLLVPSLAWAQMRAPAKCARWFLARAEALHDVGKAGTIPLPARCPKLAWPTGYHAEYRVDGMVLIRRERDNAAVAVLTAPPKRETRAAVVAAEVKR